MSCGLRFLSRSELAAVLLLDSEDEVVDAGTVGAIDPLAIITDAVDFVVEADGAADVDAGLKRISWKILHVQNIPYQILNSHLPSSVHCPSAISCHVPRHPWWHSRSAL